MTLTFKLTEGMKVGDLKELVDPTLSIDQFESKIDPDAIVVAFVTLCTIDNVAQDLSEFIETGKNGVLDTEVSPGPNENNHYVLFVEFPRDESFPENLIEVLKSMQSLTLIKDWYYTFFGGDKTKRELTMDNLKNDIRLKKEEPNDETEAIHENMDFFKNSMLDDVTFTTDNLVYLRKNYLVEVKQSIAFGNPNMILNALNLKNVPIQLDDNSLRECRNLRRMLGENWDVTKLNDYYVLANSEDDRVMVLK